MPSYKTSSLLSFFCASLRVLAGFGDPAGFLQNETINKTPVYPGIVWYEVSGEYPYEVSGKSENLPQIAHIVTVDLSQPHLTLKPLLGQRFVSPPNQFFRRSFVSQLQKDNDSLVAINTAFFDINATQTPHGLLILDQQVLRNPNSSRTALIFSDLKEAFVGNFTSQQSVVHSSGAQGLTGINHNSISNNELHLYRQPWDRSPGNSAAFAGGLPLTEAIIEFTDFIPASAETPVHRLLGKVLEVRDEMASFSIQKGQYVLTASGRARSFLQTLQPETEIQLITRLSSGPSELNWMNIPTVIAGSSRLVSGGATHSGNTDHWNARHPRSAIGIHANRQQIILLLVEGRQTGRAEGMSLHTVAAWMQYMDAHNALEFDGGGSSGIAAKIDGENKLLNTPSGGTERYVPVGLGIQLVTESENPFFSHIRTSSSDTAAVVSWETQNPSCSYATYTSGDFSQQSHPVTKPTKAHSAYISSPEDSTYPWFVRLFADTDSEENFSHLIEIPRGSPDNSADDVPHWWISHFYTHETPSHQSDTDLDGYTLYQEYIWGTDPTHSASIPETSIIPMPDESLSLFALTFAPFHYDRQYQLVNLNTSQTRTSSIDPNNPVRTSSNKGIFHLPAPSPNDHSFHTLQVSPIPQD